ncbi:MAG: LysM peptidoglycan-binding domain-containing protein, partial [Steroidobacteraceae bacterium]
GGASGYDAGGAPASARATQLASASTASADGRRMTYVVQPGDTLYGIAKLLQVTVSELMDWNGISHHHSLKPGQTLVAFVKTRSG